MNNEPAPFLIGTLSLGVATLDELKIIQDHSDEIYDAVYNELYRELEGGDHWKEDLVLGIQLIMVDSFIRCKILEEPPKNDSKQRH